MKPLSFWRITIAPASFSTVSCSSSIGEAADVAETTVMSAAPVFSISPNAADMPDSAVFTHASSTVTDSAAVVVVCAAGSGVEQPASARARMPPVRAAAKRMRVFMGGAFL